MHLILLLAATLTFNNTAANATWFSIMQIQADTAKLPIVYVRAHPAPGVVGPVTLDLPGAPGDCYLVTAINREGPSAWSNKACLPLPAGALPSEPTGAGVK